MKIEIRIVNDHGEVLIAKHQARDKFGRPTTTQKAVFDSAVSDARSWLHRNSTEVDPHR